MSSEVNELQAELCKILANPKRINIIYLLKDGEKSVLEIAKAIGISQSNTSQHLTIMKAKGVVKSRRAGNEIYYSLAIPELSQACELVRTALKRISK